MQPAHSDQQSCLSYTDSYRDSRRAVAPLDLGPSATLSVPPESMSKVPMTASDELVFTVSPAGASPASAISLADAGFRERDDLQEWVIENPEILGDGVMIAAFEFDQWRTMSGARERDRLDVLGLDMDGSLVVAELKRDQAPDTVEMQAVKYAAMASRFDPELLAAHHARFLQARTGEDVSAEDALLLLDEHTTEPLDAENFRQPRIVLVAGSFKATTTASAMWLNEMGIDVRLVQVRAYRAGAELVLTASTIYPPPSAEDFAISPRLPRREQVREQREHRRELSVVKRLVAAGTIPDGTRIEFRVGESRGRIDEVAIRTWLEADPARGEFQWVNDATSPLRWAAGGERYAPTTLAREIVHEALRIELGALRGPHWWALEDGTTLVELAEALAPETRSRRDWSDLHAIMSALPLGHWTTYGDLAEVIGSHPNPVGQHIATNDSIENAWRVLRAGGQPAEGFQWSDPSDTRSVQEVLESEGIHFIGGRADEARHLHADDLRELLNVPRPD